MKTHLVALFSLLVFTAAQAAPVTYEEVSLLVRMKENDSAILQTVSARKLLRPLSPAQESALKRSGARDSLLASLRKPQMLASTDELAYYEAQEARKREAARRALAVAPATTTVTRVPLKPVTGHTLVIDRLVITQQPVPTPFFLHVQAKAGRSEATYFVPHKRYGSKGADGPKIDIPLKLVLRDVEPNSWATVELRIDVDEEAVKTFKALKQHTARIQILDYPQTVHFTPDISAVPFSYDVIWHAE